MSSPLERTTLTSLPPELFLKIFSHLPQRTTRTRVSPLETIVKTSPSKRTLQNLSLTSLYLRDVSSPFIFEAVNFSSLQRLRAFLESGTAESVGGYVKKVVMRWESVGDLLKVDQQSGKEGGMDEAAKLVSKVLSSMPGAKFLQLDFPGAFNALEATLLSGNTLPELEFLNVRNGRWGFGGDIKSALQGLGGLRKLKSITMDGNEQGIRETSISSCFFEYGSFESLVTLDLTAIPTLSDGLLGGIVSRAKNLTSLSVNGCAAISLSATRRLLISHGYRLQHLSLEILKPRPINGDDAENGHHSVSEDEHLCPVIRDCCTNLKILDLYTNKICKEVLFPAADNKGSSGTITGGLPTPPGSPEFALTAITEIPTPPFEGSNDRTIGGEISPGMLPPPLFNFAYAYGAEYAKPATMEKHRLMKSVSLRIPYDASCFGANSGGPSPQQIFTSLCDGSPAQGLLEIGLKAFEEGLVELVKVRGHWKGGPYLIMKD